MGLFTTYGEPACSNIAPRGMGAESWRGACGKPLYRHAHGTIEGRTPGGARVDIEVPRGGPWRFCERCDGVCSACLAVM